LHKAVYAFATGAIADHLVEHTGSSGEKAGFRHHPDDWRHSENHDKQAKIGEHS
jgi:hypothetical protein